MGHLLHSARRPPALKRLSQAAKALQRSPHLSFQKDLLQTKMTERPTLLTKAAAFLVGQTCAHS